MKAIEHIDSCCTQTFFALILTKLFKSDMPGKRDASCIRSPLKAKKAKLHDTSSQGKMYCAWCQEEIKRHDARLMFGESCLPADVAAPLIERHSRRIVHAACGTTLNQFWKRADCELGDLKPIKELVDATLYSRDFSGCETLDLDIDGVTATLPIVRDGNGERNVYPLGLTKSNCHAHWSNDRRWNCMKDMARGRPAFEQILVAKTIMGLPWGTAPPYKQPKLNDNQSKVLHRIFHTKSLAAQDKANRFWQFMTRGVDKTASETADEIEFVASYAVYFLLENCVFEWSADASHVCHLAFQRCWTTSWGPVSVLNQIFSDETDQTIIPLSRQAPLPLPKANPASEVANRKRLRLMASVRHKATFLLYVLHRSRLGRSMLMALWSHRAYAQCPNIPMALGFLLCELRKRADTGAGPLTRYRLWWNKIRRQALEDSLKEFPHVRIVIPILIHRGMTWAAALNANPRLHS